MNGVDLVPSNDGFMDEWYDRFLIVSNGVWGGDNEGWVVWDLYDYLFKFMDFQERFHQNRKSYKLNKHTFK